MPRKRQTQSGAPAQNIRSVPGQRYGEGQAQQAMQRQMPAPDLVRQNSQALAQRSAPVAAPPAATGQPMMSPEDRYAATLAAAKQTAGAGLLAQGTTRPGEPVTAGLPIGPGPGPEALQPMGNTPTGQFFAQVARLTGNPYYEQLARRAGL